MELVNAPSKQVLPFAADGGKNTIPVASQIGITGGAASFTDGFPPLTRTPVAAGGIPPFGLDMNGILYVLSAITQWANAGAGYVYDGTFATNADVLGYPKGARVLRSDGTGYWLNTIDNNEVDPENTTPGAAATAGWVPDLTNGIAAVTMTNANVTLTPAQYGKPIIAISGLLTGNLNLIFPNIAGEWIVQNNTTGAFTITGKTNAGSGVVLAGNSIIFGDATNIYSSNITPALSSGTTLNGKMLIPSGSATATFTADQVVVATTLGGTSYLLSTYSQGINLATTGAGGMDTGSAPTNGYVALYAIYNPGTATTSILATDTTSAVAPPIYGGAHMPSGYTASALVSVWPTNGSNQFQNGYQLNRQIGFPSRSALSTSTPQPSYTSLSISSLVPKNALTIFGNLTATSGGGGSTFVNLGGDANGSGGVSYSNPATTTNSASSPFYGFMLPTAQTLYYEAGTTGLAANYAINVTGYTF